MNRQDFQTIISAEKEKDQNNTKKIRYVCAVVPVVFHQDRKKF